MQDLIAKVKEVMLTYDSSQLMSRARYNERRDELVKVVEEHLLGLGWDPNVQYLVALHRIHYPEVKFHENLREAVKYMVLDLEEFNTISGLPDDYLLIAPKSSLVVLRRDAIAVEEDD